MLWEQFNLGLVIHFSGSAKLKIYCQGGPPRALFTGIPGDQRNSLEPVEWGSSAGITGDQRCKVGLGTNELE